LNLFAVIFVRMADDAVLGTVDCLAASLRRLETMTSSPAGGEFAQLAWSRLPPAGFQKTKLPDVSRHQGRNDQGTTILIAILTTASPQPDSATASRCSFRIVEQSIAESQAGSFAKRTGSSE
jgi:hypothetical protein